MTNNTAETRPDRTDFLAGLVVAALGLAFAVESFRMPRLEERGINPLTAPGIVPGVLGAALCVLGLVLALRRYNPRHGHIGLSGIIGKANERVSLGIAFGLNVLFALVLVGRAPFWLSSAAYLLLFMGVFGLSEVTAAARRKRALMILLVSAGVTAGVVYLFETLFFVRLP